MQLFFLPVATLRRDTFVPHSFLLLLSAPFDPPWFGSSPLQKLYKQIDWTKFKSEDDEDEE